MLVLACAQAACARRDVIEVARVATAVAAEAVVAAAVAAAQSEPSSESPSESTLGDAEACPNPACYVDAGATLEQARSLAVDLMNVERRLRGLGAVALDDRLSDAAQASSHRLARDGRYTDQSEDADPAPCFVYDEDHRRPAGIEIQFDPNGYGLPDMDIETQVAGALSAMMREGYGGSCRDNLLSARWRHVGIGLSNPAGRLYLVLDFSD